MIKFHLKLFPINEHLKMPYLKLISINKGPKFFVLKEVYENYSKYGGLKI
jgi:hypothetical protein